MTFSGSFPVPVRSPRGSRSLLKVLALTFPSLLGLSACSDGGGATGPNTSEMEILVLAGNDQKAEAGARLPEPLRVRIQSLSTGRVQGGVNVRWKVTQGAGARVEDETTVTDSLGVTSVSLTLGPNLGEYRVSASVRGMTSPPAEFQARAIETPILTGVPAVPVMGGGIITLEGQQFSEIPADNIVTFSKVRGRVLSASSSALEVQVPSCLPTRSVEIRVRIGALVSGPATLEVLGADEGLSLEVGEDRILDGSEALSCFFVPSGSEASYLVVPHTTGTLGGAEYPLEVVGLTTDGMAPVSPPPSAWEAGRTLEGAAPAWEGAVGDLHWEWEGELRKLERALVEGALGARGGVRLATDRAEVSGARTPEVGEARDFNVLNSENKFDEVTARVSLVTDHSIIYVDETVPAGGFTQEDLLFFARHFDNPIYPTVSSIFGSESDLDGNGRVIILFTPAVNRLTTDGSAGYVGGFFFGVDLLPGQDGSNKGEIFYAVVPDPSGDQGPVLSRNALLGSLPAILAHEFGHMVHFNQRLLVSGASSQDALWLSEALAQMAEDLVGVAYQELGDPLTALDYQLGNWQRGRGFLMQPSQVSVLTTIPPGTLQERGAGWLLLRHLYGREGQDQFLGALTRSTRTGVDNLTTTIGRNWSSIVSDWVGSLYLDGLAVPVRSGLSILGLNLRVVMSRFDGSYPLKPRRLGDGPSFSISGSLWSSAPDYYILTAPASGGMALNLSGPDGRPPDPSAGLRILVVRLQ